MCQALTGEEKQVWSLFLEADSQPRPLRKSGWAGEDRWLCGHHLRAPDFPWTEGHAPSRSPSQAQSGLALLTPAAPWELVLQGEAVTLRVVVGDLRYGCPLHLGDQKGHMEER